MNGTIPGYRKLSNEELDLIKKVKNMEDNTALMCQALNNYAVELKDPISARHVALSKTYFEIGYLFAVKAVARPFGGLSGRELADAEAALSANGDAPSTAPGNDAPATETGSDAGQGVDQAIAQGNVDKEVRAAQHRRKI